MLNESSEEAHQLVALGLLARVFYASEPLGQSFSLQRRLFGLSNTFSTILSQEACSVVIFSGVFCQLGSLSRTFVGKVCEVQATAGEKWRRPVIFQCP